MIVIDPCGISLLTMKSSSSLQQRRRRQLMTTPQQRYSNNNSIVSVVIIMIIIILLNHCQLVLSTTTTTTTNTNTNQKNNKFTKSSTTTTKSKHDYIVHTNHLYNVLPYYQQFDGNMYAGLIPTSIYDNSYDNNENNGELMFWLYEPKNPTYTDTLLIWLNGGPGCSSFGGMMFENGPITIPLYTAGYYGINPNVSLQYNPYTWTNVTSIMYVEQPQGGTGFSQFGSIPNNETDVSRNFYNFLVNFYTIFDNNNENNSDSSNNDNIPKWLDKKLYFFGESYAGMFVPSIAHYIYQQNEHIKEQQQKQKHKNNEKSDNNNNQQLIIPLTGIALGNGWMDAQVQGPAVIDYAWWHGMIDTSTRKAMKNEWDHCNDGTKKHQPNPFHTFTVPDECGIMGAILQAAGMGLVDWGTPNAYDVTTWDPYLMLDAPSGSINQFFNNPEVQKALNVPPRTWVECIPGAGRRRRQRQLTKSKLPGQLLLSNDQPISVVPYVADLLDNANIRVLIYNGDRDMTTNSQGSELLLDNMVWNGASGWSNINEFERGLWLPKVGKQLGGYIKQYQNLEFLVVYNSGHLVPFNQKEIAFELVTRFLGNDTFLDKPLPKFHIHRTHQSDTHIRETHLDINNNDAYRKKETFIREMVNTIVCILVGFVVGFIVSRRFQKGGRASYQMIPNH